MFLEILFLKLQNFRFYKIDEIINFCNIHFTHQKNSLLQQICPFVLPPMEIKLLIQTPSPKKFSSGLSFTKCLYSFQENETVTVLYWSSYAACTEVDTQLPEMVLQVNDDIYIFMPVLWIRIRSDPKLFSESGSGVGSGINHFGSGSWQPLSSMNLKQNFSDKIHYFATKCTIKINK